MPISAFPRHLTVSSYLSCSTSKRFKSKSSNHWYYVCVLKSVKNTITSRVAFRYSTMLPEYLSVRSPTGNTKAEKILALLQHRPNRCGSPILFAEQANGAVGRQKFRRLFSQHISYKGGDVNVVEKVHIEYANKITRDI
ncbi:PREDICTED: uncharacterized protein LOC108764954 isoform X2 [Trachymyrmex cornetzi]|uniref:uncharacterized protein LOC108764954 isoform X2 n=1 Tax=Trachymyrmex cornetzi TaxID=471704 RepID=UPI00084F3CEC|nr:PREDICTED: uncharacterized protein LOC108764954 isoform X2 [Trachymyrmex cornetzi]